MYLTTSIVALAVSAAGLVSAMPTARQNTALSPCANITQQYSRAVAANATSYFADGQLAYECLNSMPFDSRRASAFVLELRKHLQYQSTIPVLKNPPKTYLSPAVDLLGGLDAIYQKANTSQYQSQYQMDAEITNLLSSAADGHLSASLCSIGLMSFTLGTQNNIISVSEDGVSTPKIFIGKDAGLLYNGSRTVSDIVQINGQNVTQYLSKLSLTTGQQDPDAQYNNMFSSNTRSPSDGNVFGAFVQNRGIWPGSPVISLTFANGSTSNIRVVANVPRQFNYTSGAALYARYCLPVNSTTTTSSSATSSSTPTATPAPAVYPTPIIRDPRNRVLGYYINSTAFNDTAVLFVPSFLAENATIAATQADAASRFVNRAANDGKTKIIIDVSGNGGGSINAGFDLFKLFFPDMPVYSATRQRDHESQRLTWQSLSIANRTGLSSLLNLFNYKLQVTPDQSRNFSAWEEVYGPDIINNANMTNLYANFNFTYQANTSPIRGYGGVPLNVSRQLFKPENILVVSDGYCASTCTTFVNLMTNSSFGNVRSLSFGGRPINAPMQVMGGVRGAQSLEMADLANAAGFAYVYALNRTNSTNAPLTKQELLEFNQVRPQPFANMPLRMYGGGVKLRNSYNPTDLQTPLQFAYQAASCKLFYTIENVFYPATTWISAAKAAWGNGTCVAGSQAANFTR